MNEKKGLNGRDLINIGIYSAIYFVISLVLAFTGLIPIMLMLLSSMYGFDRTVRDNIRMGKPSATDAEVEQVAKASGCYDFIMELENGFDTEAFGSGAHLSGGERQRISIARAMMKNAPILILDEATAYTDPENEAVIQKAVSSLAVGKTLIVIAHRLSTIIDSDQIVVVKDGRMEAKGTHEELLKESTLYQKMWDAHIYARDTEEGGVA